MAFLLSGQGRVLSREVEARAVMEETETNKNIEAYQSIKQLIVNQRLSPGQKLIYRDLEEILGMSKTRSSTVSCGSNRKGSWSRRRTGVLHERGQRGEAEQIFDLRERLEVISIEYAVKHRSVEDLSRLKERITLYQNHQEPIYDRKRWELDTAIHMQIAVMSKNDYFISMIKTFYDSIYFILNVVHLTPHIDHFNDEHWLLYNSIEDRDIMKATEVIKSHIQAAGKLLIAALRL